MDVYEILTKWVWVSTHQTWYEMTLNYTFVIVIGWSNIWPQNGYWLTGIWRNQGQRKKSWRITASCKPRLQLCSEDKYCKTIKSNSLPCRIFSVFFAISCMWISLRNLWCLAVPMYVQLMDTAQKLLDSLLYQLKTITGFMLICLSRY